MIKNLPAKQKTRVQSLGQEDALEEEMAAHSSVLALGNPMDRGDWRATPWGRKESDTIERLTLSCLNNSKACISD